MEEIKNRALTDKNFCDQTMKHLKEIKDRRKGVVLFECSTFLTDSDNASKTFYSYLERNRKLAPVSK